MKQIAAALLSLLLCNTIYTHHLAAEDGALTHKSIYSLTMTSIEGKSVSMESYKEKVLLIVNTASKCGFTPQYQDLEKLYEEYKDKGLVVLGFPSNDFDNQEPGSNAEIQKFCKRNFGVTFPLFQKGSVIGDEKQPLFRFLTEESDPNLAGEVEWNFEKFLIAKDGTLKARFGSYVNPMGTSIKSKIEELLE